MAETQATIRVVTDASQTITELQRASRAVSSFASTLAKTNTIQASASKELQRNLIAGISATEGYTAEVLRMRTSAAQLDATLSKGKATMGQYFSARFRKDGVAAAQVMSLANQRAAAMNTEFIASSKAMGGFRDVVAARPLTAFNSDAAIAAQKTAIMRAMLRQSTTQMINFGKNVQWAGRQIMVGFTIPLTIFGGVAGRVFRDLEKEAVNFRKVYGDMFTTDVETEKALDNVKALASEFTKLGIAASETMKLAALAAQAGQRGAQLTAATTQATRLAALGDMGGEDAMRTTIALQSAFKLSNEELAESVNFLNAVENQTVLSLQDLAGAIPRVAPVIVGLGGDVKDMAVFLAAMREGGVSAAEGANALKSSLGRLITPTRQAKDMAEGFGINLEEIVQRNKGDILSTVLDLAKAMEVLDGLQRQQLLSTVFGKFQYARIGALFENITRDGSQAMTVMNMLGMSIEDLAKTADKELKAIEESPAIKFQKAMEDLKVAIAPIGEMFIRMSIPVIQFLGKLIEKFNELPSAIKNIIGLGTIFAGVIVPVATMLIGLFINLIGQIVKFGTVVGVALKGFTTGGFKGAIDAVSQSFRYMSLAELDTANASRQLAPAIEIANKAMITQGTAARTAALGVNQLTQALYGQMAAQQSYVAGGTGLMFGSSGAAQAAGAAATAGAAAKRPRRGRLRFNQGGQLPGFGQNKDTLPAMLTPGEFVVNRDATEKNLSLLHAINDGQKLPGFMAGAHIGSAAGKATAVAKTEMGNFFERQALLGAAGRGSAVEKVKGRKYQRTHTSVSTKATSAQIDEMLAMDPTNPIAILAKKGLPVDALTDAWIRLPDLINQPLKQQGGLIGRQLKPLLNAVDTTTEDMLGPAFRGKFGPKQIIDDIVEAVDDNTFYSDRGASGKTVDSIVQEVAKKRAQQINAQFDELRMPTLRDMQANPEFAGTIRQAQSAIGTWVQDARTGLWFNKRAKGAKILVAEDATGRNAMPLAGSLMPDRTLSAMREKLITGNMGGMATPGGMVKLGKNFYGKSLYPLFKFGVTKLTPKGGVGPDAVDVVRSLRGKVVSEKVRKGIVAERLAAGDARIAAAVESGRKSAEAQRLREAVFTKIAKQRQALDLFEKNKTQMTAALSQSLDAPVHNTTLRKLLENAMKDPDLSNAPFISMAQKLDDGSVVVFNVPRGTLGINRAGNLTMIDRRAPMPGGPGIVVPKGQPIMAQIAGGTRTDIHGVNMDKTGKFAILAEIMEFMNLGGVVGYNKGGGVAKPGRMFYGGAALSAAIGRSDIGSLIPGELLAKFGSSRLARFFGFGKFSEQQVVQKALQASQGRGVILSDYIQELASSGRIDLAHRLATLSKKDKWLGDKIVEQAKLARRNPEDMLKWINSVENRGLNNINSRAGRAAFGESISSVKYSQKELETLQKIFVAERGQEHPLDPADVATAASALKKFRQFIETSNLKSVSEFKNSKSYQNGWFDIVGDLFAARSSLNAQYKARRVATVGTAAGVGATGLGGAAYATQGKQSEQYNAKEGSRQKLNMGGQVFDSARQTYVPGVGDKDTVPAVLTPGEFVINKDATRQNKALLEAINSGMPVAQFKNGGRVPSGAPGIDFIPGGAGGRGSYQIASAPGQKAGNFISYEAARKAGVTVGPAVAGGPVVAGAADAAKPKGKLRGMLGGNIGSGKMGVGLGIGASLVGGFAGFAGGAALAESLGMGETGKMIAGGAGSIIGSFPVQLAKVVAFLAKLRFTPLIAAIALVTSGFILTDKANKKYAKKGKELADAMTISIADIQKFGETARQRSQKNEQYLKALESETITSEFAEKIAKAKTKEEKKALEIERDKLIAERGSLTRREAIEEFYKKEIEAAKKRGDSEEKISKLYEQRNEALGKRFETAADFDFEKTFGAQFLTGKGEQDFARFRELAGKGTDPTIRKAELDAIQQLGQAAYGLSLTTEEIASRDMATKLAQYILSGQMTEDQARSIADAIGQQEGDLRISANIKRQLASLGGFMGADFQFSPGAVANRLADIEGKRVEQARRQVAASARGSFFSGVGSEDPTQIRNFDAARNFFSGQADEFRRSSGFLITAQANQLGMLQENISAVGLNYDSLIAKAKTSAEAENLRLERTIQIGRLQKRYDDARIEALKTLGIGTQKQIQTGRGLQNTFEREANLRGTRSSQIAILGNLREVQQKEVPGIQNISKAIGIFGMNFAKIIMDSISFLQKNIGEPIASFASRNFPADASEEMRNVLVDTVKEAQKGTEDAVIQAALIAQGKDVGVTEQSQLMTQLNLLYLESPERWKMATSGIAAALTTLEAKIQDPSTTKEQINQLEKQKLEIINMFQNQGFGTETIAEMGQLLALSSKSVETVTQVSDVLKKTAAISESVGDTAEAGVARVLPLMIKMAELNNLKLAGGETLFAGITNDYSLLTELLHDDELYLQLLNLTEAISFMGEEAQIAFLEGLNPKRFIELAKTINSFDFSKFGQEAQKAISGLQDASKNLSPKELELFAPILKNLQSDLDKISKVKDPKLKLSMQQNIIPQLLMINQLLADYVAAKGPAEKELILRQIVDISTQTSVDAGKTKDGEGIPEEAGGGAPPPDPYQDLIRPIRESIDLLAKEGRKILGASDVAKGLYDKARNLGLDESILSLIRSLSAEDQINVLEQVTKSQAKRNTLFKLVSENSIANARDMLKTAKEEKQFYDLVTNSKVLANRSLLEMTDLYDDEEFMKDLMAAAQQGNVGVKDFMKLYDSAVKKQENLAIARAKTNLPADILRTQLKQKAFNEFAAGGMTEEDISAAMANENIMTMVNKSIKDNGKITKNIIDEAKKFVQETKTVADLIKEGFEFIEDISDIAVTSLKLAIEKIEKNSIEPLEKQIDEFRKQSEVFAEEQTILNKGLENIGKLESKEQERLQEIEEQINEEYDLRLSALDKIENANQRIADQQQGQIDLASALSRGDIAAAAKAQIEMQKRSAQGQLTDTKEGLREKQEKTVATIREESEQRIKGFTAEVNGQLLTREQIENRIEQIQETLYNNARKEYDLQQKINTEKERTQKIQEQINKLNAKNEISETIQRIASEKNLEVRKGLLEIAKLQINLLDAEDAAAFNAKFDQFASGLLSEDFQTRSQAALGFSGAAISQALTPTATLPSEIQSVIDAANAAIVSKDGPFQKMIDQAGATKTRLEELNPFKVLTEGTENFVNKIKKMLFEAVKPKPGSGAGAGPQEPPKEPGDKSITGSGKMRRSVKEAEKFTQAQMEDSSEAIRRQNIPSIVKMVERDKEAIRAANIVGSNISQGIIEGINRSLLIGKINFTNFFNDILSWLGIKSPSMKAINEIGVPVGQGILEGIKQQLAQAINFLTVPFLGFINFIKSSLGLGADAAENLNSPKGLGSLFGNSLLGAITGSITNKEILNEKVLPAFNSLLSNILNFLQIGDVGKLTTSPFSMGKQFMTSIFGGISKLIQEFDYPSMIQSFIDTFLNYVRKAEVLFKGIGQSMWSFIKLGILDLIPESIKGIVQQALNLFAYGGKVPKMAYGGKVNYKGSREPAPGMALGGSIIPGMGNTDRVPAMLMPGEYVVNKASTKAFLPLLQMINESKYPGMLGGATPAKIGPLNLDFNNISKANIGPINRENISNVKFSVPQKFDSNVDVESRNVSMIDASERNNSYFLNIDVGGTNASPDAIANAVIGKIRMMEDKQIRGVRR